jgi:hypothetical protein
MGMNKALHVPGGKSMKFQIWPLFFRFLISQFVGIIIFSIGIGAIFPSLNYIAAPIVCPGGSMSTNTESYSYRPGEVYTSITQMCGNKATGQVEDVSWPATLVAGVMYGIIFFFLSFLLTYFMNKRLNKMRTTFAQAPDSKLTSELQSAKNVQEIQNIMERLQHGSYSNQTPSSPPGVNVDQGDSAMKRLQELRDLHTAGLINTDEYERKKEEILKGL